MTRVQPHCSTSLFDLSPISGQSSGQSWVGQGAAIDLSALPMPHSPSPIETGSTVRLGYGLDEIAQAGVLADGDGAVDIHLAADRDQGVSIASVVGAHRELSGGPGVANPPHRLTQEVGGAPNGVGPGPRAAETSARRRCRPQQPRPGPAARDSPDPTGGRGPTGSCAGTFPGWMAP